MENLNKTPEVVENNDNEKGATMLEYAMLAALIAVVALAAISFLGAEVNQTFSHIGNEMSGANN